MVPVRNVRGNELRNMSEKEWTCAHRAATAKSLEKGTRLRSVRCLRKSLACPGGVDEVGLQLYRCS